MIKSRIPVIKTRIYISNMKWNEPKYRQFQDKSGIEFVGRERLQGRSQ